MTTTLAILALVYFVGWTRLLVTTLLGCGRCSDYTYYIAKLGGNMFIGSILILSLTVLDGVLGLYGFKWLFNCFGWL